MLDAIAKRIATITSQQRSLVFKALSLIGGRMIFLILFPFYHRFIEEKELLKRFGTDYEDYRNTTPFLFPRLRRHSSKQGPDRHGD
jgi:protein-S-isoprenylcysteine O-methyltransferase Ste14